MAYRELRIAYFGSGSEQSSLGILSFPNTPKIVKDSGSPIHNKTRMLHITSPFRTQILLNPLQQALGAIFHVPTIPDILQQNAVMGHDYESWWSFLTQESHESVGDDTWPDRSGDSSLNRCEICGICCKQITQTCNRVTIRFHFFDCRGALDRWKIQYCLCDLFQTFVILRSWKSPGGESNCKLRSLLEKIAEWTIFDVRSGFSDQAITAAHARDPAGGFGARWICGDGEQVLRCSVRCEVEHQEQSRKCETRIRILRREVGTCLSKRWNCNILMMRCLVGESFRLRRIEVCQMKCGNGQDPVQQVV